MRSSRAPKSPWLFLNMYSVGSDIVLISRIAHWVEDPAMLDFIFTKEEQSAALKGRYASKNLASAFAIKESFMKAVGAGWGEGLQWKDIEAVMSSRRVFVKLHNRAMELCAGRSVHASSGCSGNFAVALVVID